MSGRADRRWEAAVADHDDAVTAFVGELARIPMARWHERIAEHRWSAAEEALHVAITYELGATAPARAMRLRVSPGVATLSRVLLLPWILRTGKFPRGVAAPREVRPAREDADASTPESIALRTRAGALRAATALRGAHDARPRVRLTHAYFGGIMPLDALRLLSAHTRHHARRLAKLGPATP